MKRIIATERGFVVLVAVSLVAILGIAALAIDLGMLRKAKAEAQRAADASALAGASAFVMTDLDVTTETANAVHEAYRVADTNYMNGVKFDTTSEVTVQVIAESVKVRVTVRRAAVPTWFAQIFGINSLPVGAKAAAVADYAAGTNCVKPIAIADMWGDGGDLPLNGGDGDHYFDAGETWLYAQDPQPDVYQPADSAFDGSGTGYGSAYRDAVTRDWGLQIMVRPSTSNQETSDPCLGTQGNKCYYPGWWGLWGPPPGPGASDVVSQFKACTSLASPTSAWNDSTYTVGTDYEVQTGWVNPVARTVEQIYNLDPGAHWDPTVTDALTGKTGTVVGSSLGSNWRSSPRTWIVAVVRPDAIPSASEDISFNNFMLIFFEGCKDDTGVFTNPIDCAANDKTIVARFLGRANGTATGPAPGTMIRILRLVE
jgi:hypothetical protein